MFWLDLLVIVVVAGISAAYSRYYLHMLQLESYQLDGYQRWLNKNRDKLVGATLNLGIWTTLGEVVLNLFLNMVIGETAARVTSTLLALAAFGIIAGELTVRLYQVPAKKPFVLTRRMKRLYAALIVLTILGASLLAWIGVPVFLLFVAVPYLTYLAGLVMQPIERRINDGFLREAREKLEARSDLIKIGITGSYGKTSTKFILQAILQEKFDVLATPSSFNTPMGLTRVIREKLEDHHQVFLAEMGARHVGDIQELCDLVHPGYGVLTSVGPQHLETFGTIENVAHTKYELIENLPDDGVAFFAADGDWCDRLFAETKIEKYRAGLGSGYLSMYAENITVGPHGSSFTLCDAEGGRVRANTKLLGRHNIANIVLSAMVARRLGLSLNEIARGIGRAKPVEHRLQLIEGAGGVTVIDDAFNANPVGAKAALDVLHDFPGRHIIVTPDMVEQGEQEEEINRRFGMQVADSADIAIFVGNKRSKPMVDGAREKGMARDKVLVAATLSEATTMIGRLCVPGDVVLFENDLPDNYSES